MECLGLKNGALHNHARYKLSDKVCSIKEFVVLWLVKNQAQGKIGS